MFKGKGAAVAGGLGLFFGIVGFLGYNARDVIMETLHPESRGATREDVTKIEKKVELGHEAQVATLQKTEIAVSVIESYSEQQQRQLDKMDELLSNFDNQAQAQGVSVSPAQSLEFENAARSVLESTDETTSVARNALENNETLIAAQSLQELAEKQQMDSGVSDAVTAETWRKAAAILYSIDPAQSATAYKKAAELSSSPARYTNFAMAAMEAERRRRASSDAPGARLVPGEYSGPIKPFTDGFDVKDVAVTPKSCEAANSMLRCTLDVQVDGSDEMRIEFRDVVLVDDWMREFKSTSLQFSGRNSNNNSIDKSVAPGHHVLSMVFEGIPGGSNYGLELKLNDEDRLRWRSVPAEGLDSSLRADWGGPLGLAAFTPVNEELALEPYGLKLQGCERLGRRLACYGQIGYEGPRVETALRDVHLEDGQGRSYEPYYLRLRGRQQNSNYVDAYLDTGLWTFEAYFWRTPIHESYSLKGQVGPDKTGFAFSPIRTNEDDTLAKERIGYFWDIPARLSLGDNRRLQDFKFFPKKCERQEYSVNCSVEFYYVGEYAEVAFKDVHLVDNKNNVYQPTSVSLGDRKKNSSYVDKWVRAGRHTLTANFDSVPTSRLYELEFTANDSYYVTVSGLALPAKDGAMGLPSDISYITSEVTQKAGPLNITLNGCARRTTALDCYLAIEYSGPKQEFALRDIALVSASGEPASVSSVRLNGRKATNSTYIDTRLDTGIYQMRAMFDDVPNSGDARIEFNVNKSFSYKQLISPK